MSWSSLASYETAFDGSCMEELPHHDFHRNVPFRLGNSCIDSNGDSYSHSELTTSPKYQAVHDSAQVSNLQQLLISNQLTSNHPTPLSPNPPTSTSLTWPLSKGIPPQGIQKRKLNTLAARKYRQKRVDHIKDLEAALKESQKARYALKIRVARLEGEVEVLRRLVGG